MDRYLRVVKWARTRDNRRPTLRRGPMLSDYQRIERAAWSKYMEGRPE